MERGDWWATVCRIARVGHDLSNSTTTIIELKNEVLLLLSKSEQDGVSEITSFKLMLTS